MRIALLLTLATLCTACAQPFLEQPPWPPAAPIASRPEADARPYQPTSLWADGAALTRVYDDRRARRVGDLVTVVVVESSEASREASTGVSRDTSVSAGVDALLGAPDHLGLPNLYKSGAFEPRVGASTANSFQGAGNTKRKDLLRTRVAARVVEVLADGNLMVEGRRQVKVNEETQYLFVRGMARPVDISPDNTVSSVALADAQILYGGSGLVSSQQSPGWMYRVLDAVWPF
ncbi:MAG: flagellar basal body L-ring protein FlgH [Deferrisomatales bacterium]